MNGRMLRFDLTARMRVYFVIALIPALYWSFFSLVGVWLGIDKFYKTAAGTAVFLMFLSGLCGPLFGLLFILRFPYCSRKEALAASVVIVLLSMLMSYVLYTGFVPGKEGFYFGFILLTVALLVVAEVIFNHLILPRKRLFKDGEH